MATATKKKETPDSGGLGGHSAWTSKIVGHDRVDPHSLIANPLNFRKHPQAQRDALRDAIAEVGFIRSVTVNKRTGNLIDGHERVWQALTSEQPFIDVEYVDLSEEDEKKALATMDPISEMAEVDGAALELLLKDVQTGSEALQQMLSDLAIDSGLLEQANAEIIEDEAPEPPADPITKPGDVWILGEHRLMCGDSTKAEDVARLLGGAVPFIMVTDPPYGVEYDPTWRNARDLERGMKPALAQGAVTNDHRSDWSDAWELFPGVVAYVWHGALHSMSVGVDLQRSGLEIRSSIIWAKHGFPLSRGDYHWQHEPCWYAVRKGDASKWCGDRKQSTVWAIDGWTFGAAKRQEFDEATGHGTQKPVECMARPIRNHGSRDDDVYDPFSGSGTTIIAAEQLHRRCYAMEISPAYCDVAVARWEKLTGKQAERSN